MLFSDNLFMTLKKFVITSTVILGKRNKFLRQRLRFLLFFGNIVILNGVSFTWVESNISIINSVESRIRIS